MVSLVLFHRFTLVACVISFVYSVEDVFTNYANFRLAWVNESTGRVIYEILFVVCG